MKYFERPDIISIYDDKIVGIEHFEFDSYHNGKKGSDSRIKLSEIDRNLDRCVENCLESEGIVRYNDELKPTASYQNYITNFSTHFCNHYGKIDSYLSHISDKNNCRHKKIEMWFFIEDATPLGNYYIEKGSIYPLIPFCNEGIISMLEKSPKCNGIIFRYFAHSKNFVLLVHNDPKSLTKLKYKIKDIKEEDFFSYTPQVSKFIINGKGD